MNITLAQAEAAIKAAKAKAIDCDYDRLFKVIRFLSIIVAVSFVPH